VWSTYLESHAGLAPWGVKPGDMFLLWAQQWHYAAKALELGYSVMRVGLAALFTTLFCSQNTVPLMTAGRAMLSMLHVTNLAPPRE
jgi:hypothetical protein